MSFAMYIFRLIWPFLKELVLGGATLQEGMKTQRKMVLILFFISVLLFILFLVGPAFYQLSKKHTELQNSVEAANVRKIEAENKELKDKISHLEAGEKPPATTPPPSTEVKAQEPVHRHPEPKTPPKNDYVVPNGVSARKKLYMDFFDTPNDD